MKLSIGENIRKRRRSADMTQEQLATALGVSLQSVSRWETGATYPDMELIPTIAAVFGCTVDELFHSTEEGKWRYSKELLTQLKKAATARDEAAVIAALQKIHRSVREDSWRHNFEEIYFILYCTYREERSSLLPELRLLTEEILRYSVRQKIPQERFMAVKQMAIMEDETHIEEFLNAHASGENSSREALLFSRYFALQDSERFQEVRQYRLWNILRELIEEPGIWHGLSKSDPAATIRRSELNLAYLHSICGKACDPRHPVTGDGSIDLWCTMLLERGFELAGAKKKIGDEEGVFLILEDIVSMLEKIMAIQEDRFELSCASPFFSGFHVDAEFRLIGEDIDSPERMLHLQIRDREAILVPSEWLILYKIFIGDPQEGSRYEEFYHRIEAYSGKKSRRTGRRAETPPQSAGTPHST